jgi:hypothetical protein
MVRWWRGALRPLAAVAAGNLLGWGAWRLAWWAMPGLWAGQSLQSGWPTLVGLTAVTAIFMAGPPVLVGALTARLAGSRLLAALGVGLLSGLWSLTLVSVVPAGLPIAPGVWYATTALVLFSGAMGGWTMSGNGWAAPKRM